jgi:ATP-binding cassette subfamily B protein
VGSQGFFREAARSGGRIDEEVFGAVFNYRVVTRMAPYVRPYGRLVAVSIAAMLIFTGTQVAVPWLIKVGIDDFISVGDGTGLTLVVGLFLGNAMLNWGSGFTQEFSIAQVGQGMLYRLRLDVFSHLQRQSVSFYDRNEVGRLMSRVLGDVYQLQEFLSVAVVTVGDLLSLAGIVVALMFLNVKLGLIAMVTLPVLVLIMAIWQPLARKAFIRVRQAAAIVNGALNENIAGVRVVQSMNRQGRNLELFEEKNRENLRSNLFATRMAAGLLPSVDMLTAISIGLVLYFGAGLVSDSALEIGALVAFVMYIQRFFDPIRSLTMQYTQLQRAMASGIRIFELLDTVPELADVPNALELPRLSGDIEFRNVSYNYVAGQDVLNDVNIHIRPGQTAAIVGPTGAGKTTLVSLASRFYDVQPGRGSILVDGHDIRDASRSSLVRQMSMVLQEPFLFTGTVRDNIKYNHENVSEEQMVEAARAVGANDFIEKLEDGYDTFLQERGVNLSVGQRQLVSFARAIVADPRILILDEATANIDSYTEMLIQRALQTLLRGRTAIVIAHRLSTIRGADQIIVLNHGRVEETGTHDQLMDGNGLYAHLYAMNFAALKEALPGNGGG